MKTPHKHAEVTIAWLKDQSIKLEFRRPLPGAMWEVTYGLMNPMSNPDYEWRVKPEPKPDIERYGIALHYWGRDVAEAGDNIKLTFCGETGKLKSAEVIS